MKYRFLFLFTILSLSKVYASKIDTVWVHSKVMNKTIPNIVVLPDSYYTQNQHYPVLYLLHGAGGDYSAWLSNIPDVRKYADNYNIILVCPDGGFTSWYFDSPMDTGMKYESYIARELVEAIDSKYNTRKDKTGRAITGYSMGGHGAFYLAFRHQDIWGAAGSLSGGLDILPFPDSWDIALRLGSLKQHPENWQHNSVINMLDLLHGDGLRLIFDCGVDDFFYDVNKNMHARLIQNKIPHDYIERPGDHGFAYWTNAIKYQMVFFDSYFKMP